MINAVKFSNNASETYLLLSRTCWKTHQLIQRKKEILLPRIYMKFPEGVFGSLPRWHNKSKVIVFKIPKIFCTLSGVAISIPEIMVTEIRNLHGFSLSLKSTPGMRSNITTGSPLQKPSLFSGITVKFTY